MLEKTEKVNTTNGLKQKGLPKWQPFLQHLHQINMNYAAFCSR